jgi:hypothetical protein
MTARHGRWLERDSEPGCHEAQHGHHPTRLVRDFGNEARVVTSAENKIIETGPDFAGDKDERLLGKLGQRDRILTREAMRSRKGDDEALLADPLDQESAVRDWKQRERDLDPASSERLDLLLCVQTVELDSNVRMPREEDRENFLQNPTLRRRAATNREAADLAAPCLMGDLHGMLRITEHLTSLLEKQPAGFRKRDRPPIPPEQLDTELPLEVLDLVRERRLRDV